MMIDQQLHKAIADHPKIAPVIESRDSRYARVELSEEYKIEYIRYESFSDPGMAHTRIDWHDLYRAYRFGWFRWKCIFRYDTSNGDYKWKPKNMIHLRAILASLTNYSQ